MTDVAVRIRVNPRFPGPYQLPSRYRARSLAGGESAIVVDPLAIVLEVLAGTGATRAPTGLQLFDGVPDALVDTPVADSEADEATAPVRTLDATPTVLWRKALIEDRSYIFQAAIAGRRVADGVRGSYLRAFRAYRDTGGAAVLHGDDIAQIPDVEDVAAWAITVQAAANEVQILVTGQAGTPIDWTAEVKIAAVRS